METPQLLSEKIHELDRYLEDVPNDLKREWMEAQRRAPSLFGREHKLLFLRFENFHIELAALRLMRYWSVRVELFGSPKAFLPMTLEGAMRDDACTLSYGTLVYTHAYDERGCGILYERFERFTDLYRDARVEWPITARDNQRNTENAERPAEKKKKKKRKFTRALNSAVWRSITRVEWYMFHVALRDEKVRQNGLIFLSRPRPVSFFLFCRILDAERRQSTLLIDFLRGCLPIRIRAFHMCQPALAFALLMAVKYKPRAKGPFMENSPLYVHNASEKRILQRLNIEHGFPMSSIPHELGGNWDWEHSDWLIRQRRVEEEKEDDQGIEKMQHDTTLEKEQDNFVDE